MKDLIIELGLNKARFIRQCAKRNRFQLTYSVIFKEWKLDKEKNKYRLQLIRSGLFPAQINDVVNIMYVLIKKNKKTHPMIVAMAIELWDKYQAEIDDYVSKRYPFNSGIKPLSPKKAFREQKARGFVKLNDFDDYNRRYDHIQSTINTNYYYPMNFPYKPEQLMRDRKLGDNVIIAYAGISAIGVRGYTRVEKAIVK